MLTAQYKYNTSILFDMTFTMNIFYIKLRLKCWMKYTMKSILVYYTYLAVCFNSCTLFYSMHLHAFTVYLPKKVLVI